MFLAPPFYHITATRQLEFTRSGLDQHMIGWRRPVSESIWSYLVTDATLMALDVIVIQRLEVDNRIDQRRDFAL
jgi:hypothetical protein